MDTATERIHESEATMLLGQTSPSASQVSHAPWPEHASNFAMRLRGWAPQRQKRSRSVGNIHRSHCTSGAKLCAAHTRKLLREVAAAVAAVDTICNPVTNAFAGVQSLQDGKYNGFQHIFEYITTWRHVGFEAVPGDKDKDVPCSVLQGHTSSVSLAVWSPGGETIATCSWDGTARLWDAATHQQLHVLNTVQALPTLANCRPLRDHEHRVDSLEEQRPEINPNGKRFNALAWSRDGSTITTRAGTSHSSGVVCVKCWSAHTGNPIPVTNGPMQRTRSPAWSPDGCTLATKSDDGTVRLWSTRGAVLKELHGHTELVRSIGWKPDGSVLATGGRDVRMWDVGAGTVLHVLRGHTHWICCLEFSPGGTTLATGSFDETIRLWDSATGTCVQVLYGHTGVVNSVAWSPDGGIVASASEDSTARIWYPATRERRFIPHCHSSVWYFEPVRSEDASCSEDFDWGS